MFFNLDPISPFGGCKESGFGREGGAQGLLAYLRLDANDVLYALEASRDYNPGPGLEKIQARLLAVNFADDLINPPELGLLEREIKRVKQGKAVMIPESDRTRGHGTHTMPALWQKHLAWLLRKSEP